MTIQTIRHELKDPRYFQLLFLGSFLTYGLLYLGWNKGIFNYLATVITAVVTQIVFSLIYKKPLSGVKSALITSLGLSMLLKASSPVLFALAAFVAIASKFVFRFNGKHLFNPANIGIIAVILLSENAWVSPGQWGSGVLLVFFMGVAGITVLLRVNRLETTISFLATLFLLQYARNIAYLGWDWPVLWHKFSSGTLLLFAFFMITDPMTIPNSSRARVVWAAFVAVLTFVLSQWFYVYAAAVWALFIVTPLTVLADYLMKAPKFEWTTNLKSVSLASNHQPK